MIFNTDISSDTNYISSNIEIWYLSYCKQTSTWFLTLTPDLTLWFDLLMLIYDLLHTDINMILMIPNTDTWFNTETDLLLISDVHTDINMTLNTDIWSNTCWHLIYYTLTSTWLLTLISHETLAIISHQKVRSHLRWYRSTTHLH